MKLISGCNACLMVVWLLGCDEGKGPSQRLQSQHNMHEISRAIRAHAEDRKGKLPAPAFRDPFGRCKKPQLSWRVGLLRYLDEDQLFREFRFDEPWDSEHNRKLIPKMPDVYRNPRVTDRTKGMTCYLLPVGEETAFPRYTDLPNEKGELERTEVKRADVNDETIILLEVAPENAVVWTKPDDWQYDPQDPRHGLFVAGRGYFQITFADGKVTTVPHHISKESMRALITRSDDDDPGDYRK